MHNKERLKRNIALAVVGGAFVGTAAGFASQPRRASPPQNAQAAAVIVEPVAPPAPAAPASRPPAAEPQRPARDDGGSAVARARDLAQRGDVSALLALRDEIIQRSQQSGESESAATQRELEEVDRYITEARLRRLKIDGAALQKSEP